MTRKILATTRGKAFALKALERRRRNTPDRIDNSTLLAGSPMFFYCISCSHVADTLSEYDVLTIPKQLCKECQALKDLGWLD